MEAFRKFGFGEDGHPATHKQKRNIEKQQLQKI